MSQDDGAQNYVKGQLEGLQREINFSFNGEYDPKYISEKLQNIAKTYGIKLKSE